MPLAAALMAAAMALSAGTASAAPNANAAWGQAVKECNQTSCYPGGTSRGAYVQGQAQDESGFGYGQEIHTLANPGQSDPQSGNF